MQIRNARVTNVSVSYDSDRSSRLEFDIETRYGDFHYDSDYTSLDIIKGALREFGLWDNDNPFENLLGGQELVANMSVSIEPDM